ncbi:MAG: hypothetical protein LBE18_09730 [Planctomycetaceae bacterium]|jgi:hypothetical protein|nr:hypothetical protein [Planctomycetaceae bacterium]
MPKSKLKYTAAKLDSTFISLSDLKNVCLHSIRQTRIRTLFRQILLFNFAPIALLFFFCIVCFADNLGDCLWGGSNEETSYTTRYFQSGQTIAQVNQPPMNIGAPVPSIPVQAAPSTRSTLIPQANIPTISPVTGNVGSVGQPATGTVTTSPNQPNYMRSSNSTGVEIVYVIPSQNSASDIFIDGKYTRRASAVTVVAAGTPGAIPVAVKTVTAYKPRIDYKLKFAPIKQKTETLVNVINPRTKRIVRRYYETGEKQITALPVLHCEEKIVYETITARVGTPIKQNYPQNYLPNYLPNSPQNYSPVNQPNTPNSHRVLYLDQMQNQPQPSSTDSQIFTTEIF